MKILVIGGTGVVSTPLVRALTQQGGSVTVFNRGRTISRLEVDVQAIHGDRNNLGEFQQLMAGREFDVVVDMVCSTTAQAQCDQRIFLGRACHFIFCSTTAVYGNTQTLIPTTEGRIPIPISAAAKEKLSGERIFMEAQRSGRMNVTIFRLGHTFGPGAGLMDNLGPAGGCIERLRRGLPIVVCGDGNGLKQSIYCDDAARAIALAAGNKRTWGEIYNLVGPDVVTWDQYTQRVAAAIGAPVPRFYHISTDMLLKMAPGRYPMLADTHRFHTVYSDDKLRRDIPQFRHSVPFEEGVRRTVTWMDANPQLLSPSKHTDHDRWISRFEALTDGIRAGSLTAQ